MQKIKLRTEESGKKLSAAYAPPKWSETAEEEEDITDSFKLNSGTDVIMVKPISNLA